ncbi:MAG: hypothetical protein P4L42_06450 [Desulfocapsaceae bacterium]|nr:hypothetical protein [Desulfocapsaceae bacterium]
MSFVLTVRVQAYNERSQPDWEICFSRNPVEIETRPKERGYRTLIFKAVSKDSGGAAVNDALALIVSTSGNIKTSPEPIGNISAAIGWKHSFLKNGMNISSGCIANKRINHNSLAGAIIEVAKL